MSRRVKRTGETMKTKSGYSTQREGDYSSRRSNRGGDNFINNPSSEKKELYCVTYFKNNPNSMDTRPPDEKLQELNDQLDSDMMGDVKLEPSEKFKALTQIKSLTYMLHGENSSEMIRAYANLGYFYNDNNRPQSAIRNFEKAHNLERSNAVDKDESINIAIETAKAHLSMRSVKGSSSSKQASQADEALSPYYETEIEKLPLRHKRDLIRSRILAALKKYDESIKSYEQAVKSLKELNENELTEAEAKIFIEMAQTADKKHKKEMETQAKTQTQDQTADQTETQTPNQTPNQTQASDQIPTQNDETAQSVDSNEYPQISRQASLYYKRAYDIYTKLGMEEEAKNIEPLLLSDEYSYYYDEEEEEEEESPDILEIQRQVAAKLAEKNNNNEEEEQHNFTPKEPSENAASRSSSRRRQFIEKAQESGEGQSNNGEEKHNEEETEAAEAQEGDVDNNKDDAGEEEKHNEEETEAADVKDEGDEQEGDADNNKEDAGEEEKGELEKQADNLISGLTGADGGNEDNGEN